MVFCVVYKASKEYKNRGLIPKRLKALGCRPISKSFWEVDDKKVNEVLNIISENQPILLKRTRETKRPNFDDENNLVDIGNLAVVVYNAEKDEKNKIRALLRKTPYIRSVYAFCQNHSCYDKKNELIDVSHVFSFIKEIDDDVRLFPRMTIVNTDSIKILIDKVKLRIEKEIDEIIKDYRDLLQKALRSEIDKAYLKDEEKKLRKKIIRIRKIANFYEKWLRIDFAKTLMRIYPVTRKIQSTSLQ
ncbi:MAG: hypothetical protein QXH91_05785 [Candidatus Bathyarchaeia archaeon]